MDLVDEQQRARTELVAARGRLGDRLADILHTCIDGGQGGQLCPERLTEQPCERGLATPGRSPEQQRRNGTTRRQV